MIWLHCTSLSCAAKFKCPYHSINTPTPGVEIEKVTKNYLINKGRVNKDFCDKYNTLEISIIPYDENKDLQ